LDSKQELSLLDLKEILDKAEVDETDHNTVIDFLFYYGVIGLRATGGDQYIFNVNYDPKILQIRALLAGQQAHYVVNPGFWPALGIQ
jgi:hypothetical protein